MNFARIWTAVTRQPSRDNTEMRSGIGTANFIDPNDVDIQPSTSVKRDVFEDGLIRRSHRRWLSICSELPPQSFLRSGAKYTLLGDSATPRLQKDPTSWEGSQDTPRLVLDPAASSLYRALCADPANGGACAFPRTVVLSSHLACNGRECAVNTARVVKLTSSTNVTQYYEYEPAPCVELKFYENARYTWEHYYRYCLDPASIGGGAMCCDHTSDDWQTSQHECEYLAERVTYATAEARCMSKGKCICPSRPSNRGATGCGYSATGRGGWTSKSAQCRSRSTRRMGGCGSRPLRAQKVARGLWQPLPRALAQWYLSHAAQQLLHRQSLRRQWTAWASASWAASAPVAAAVRG